MDINTYQPRTGRILKEDNTVINEADIYGMSSTGINQPIGGTGILGWLSGIYGLLISICSVVKATYNGAIGGTVTCDGYTGYSILLINDGTINIVVSVNGLIFTVGPREILDERVGAFTSLTITNGVQHRRRIRGV